MPPTALARAVHPSGSPRRSAGAELLPESRMYILPAGLRTRLASWARRVLATVTRNHQHRDAGLAAGPGSCLRLGADDCMAMAHAVVATDAAGVIVRANVAAAAMLQAPDPESLQGARIAERMAQFSGVDGERPALPPAWFRCPVPRQADAQDPARREWRIFMTPLFDARDRHAGWLLQLIEQTEGNLAIRHREAALRLMTHDLRVPNSSVLALLELCASSPEAISRFDVLPRIERDVRRALELSDSFVEFVDMSLLPFSASEHDLVETIQEAVDGLWQAAKERGVSLRLDLASTAEARVHGDPTLLRMTLAGLLRHALQCAPDSSQVACSLQQTESCWELAVTACGDCIRQPDDRQPRRIALSAGQPDLPLTLATAVAGADRHGATIYSDGASASSARRFVLVLPKLN